MGYRRGEGQKVRVAGSWRWWVALMVVVAIAGCGESEDGVSETGSPLVGSSGAHGEGRHERRVPGRDPRCSGPGHGSGGSLGGGGRGVGGAGGHGGAVGQGGSRGGPGGGGGISPPPLCTGTPPFTGDITGPVSLPVGLYSFATGALAAPVVAPVYASDGTLTGFQASIDPGATTDPANASVGFGVGLPGCLDASAFTGVRFTLGGDLGTCTVGLQVIDNERNSVLYGGACVDSACYTQPTPPLPLGTSTVRLADLGGGNPPGPLDVTRLNDVAWVIAVPTDGVTAPCQANLTVTDISFVE